uniref:Vesicle transport through interaction with t-SNAREs 1A n=1 Tax=Sphenodon punctatus TaxID=8508 RepID=A0A8D0L3W0_SPHPU
MSSDFEGYEQDFAVLTAEVTGRIGKVPKLLGDEKKQMVTNVEKQLEEARELLEQMELEVREIPPQSRGMYSSRMRSYKQEMGKLEADFKRSRIAYSDEVRNDLLGDDGNSSENQRAHLLDNTERLERSSRRLEAGYQIAVETGKDSESEQIVLLMHSILDGFVRSAIRVLRKSVLYIFLPPIFWNLTVRTGHLLSVDYVGLLACCCLIVCQFLSLVQTGIALISM